jgi:hypothetical protein
MKRIFISYAREDKPRVDDLARRLRQLEYEPWIDNELRGGQKWWDVILGNIAGSDLFLCMISHSYLDSEACALERNYAQATGRPIVPVKIANVTESAMPSDLAGLHIVSYTAPGEEAAFALVDAMRRAPDAPPLPSPMPPAPPAPMSYLTGAADAVARPQLTKSEQRQVLDELERGLRSDNPDDREAAREILGRMRTRDDLYADVVARMDGLDDRDHGHRWIAVLIAAGVALVAILGAGVLWNSSRQETPNPPSSPVAVDVSAIPVTTSPVAGVANSGVASVPAAASSPSPSAPFGPLSENSDWRGRLISDPYGGQGQQDVLKVGMLFTTVASDGQLEAIVNWKSATVGSSAFAKYRARGRIVGAEVTLEGYEWISRSSETFSLDSYQLTLDGATLAGRYTGASNQPGDAGTAQLTLQR